MKVKYVRMLLSLFLFAFVSSVLTGCTSTAPTGIQGPSATSQKPHSENGDPDHQTEASPKTPLPLQGYRIVIPDRATNSTVEDLVARELKEMLAQLDCEVFITEDQGNASICEKAILIGKTAGTAEDMPVGNTYSVKESNGTVQISADTYYGYRAALEYFKSKLTRQGELPRNTDHTSTARVSQVTRSTNDSIRVMFYNVYGVNNWKKSEIDGQGNAVTKTLNGELVPPSAIRQEQQADLIATYAPDVIGFQEYANGKESYQLDYHGTFTPILIDRLGYTQIEPGIGGGNATPLFYNANKLSVVESGFSSISKTDDTKSVTWAVFSVKNGSDAGKTFAIFNTHFAFENGEAGDTAREENAKALVSLINEVTENGTVAAFMGGDLNFWNSWKNHGTPSSRKPYEALVNGGMTLVSNISGVKTNFWTSSNRDGYTNSCHGFYEYDADKRIFDLENSSLTRVDKSQYTLDYIFIRNQAKSTVTVKKYYILEDILTKQASDHCPTLMDFVLN